MSDASPPPGRPLVRGPHGEELVQVIPQPCPPGDGQPGVLLVASSVRLIGDEALRLAEALTAAWHEANGTTALAPEGGTL